MIMLEFRNKKTNDFIGDDNYKTLEDAYRRIEALKIDSKFYKGQIIDVYNDFDEHIDTIDFDEIERGIINYE